MWNDEVAGRTSAQGVAAAALLDTTTQVVFIDSRTPDIADLINGALPGEQVFVLRRRDGLDQIATILKANDLTGLSAISLVGHGASGEIDLGSAVIDDANLGDNAAALSAIGASLAPGGDLALYACDTAAGAVGHQFIADLTPMPVASTSPRRRISSAAPISEEAGRSMLQPHRP